MRFVTISKILSQLGFPNKHHLFEHTTVNAKLLICILNAASSDDSTSTGSAMQSHHLRTNTRVRKEEKDSYAIKTAKENY